MKFASQKSIIQIANAYFGMMTQLRFYNVWRHFASLKPALRSQFWHRDQDDFQIVKMFLHLENVEAGSGPFTYALGTHSKGKFRCKAPSFLEPGRKNPRSTDEQLRTLVSEDKWVECTGPEGTIIFADTTGYHKGGLARTKDRLLFNCMFVSKAAKCETLFQKPKDFILPEDRETAFALSA